jgi:putative DNA primase/helicase
LCKKVHLKEKTEFFKDAKGHVFRHDKSNNTGWCGIKLTDEFKHRREDAETEGKYSVSERNEVI